MGANTNTVTLSVDVCIRNQKTSLEARYVTEGYVRHRRYFQT